jgi:hypothetical protein
MADMRRCACAASKVHRAEAVNKEQADLVGVRKKDFLSGTGAPVSRHQAEGLECLPYFSGGDIVAEAGCESAIDFRM